VDKKKPPSVCLLDFDLQYGSVATYLDLPRREVVVEFLQDAHTMDVDAFKQALVGYGDRLSVFTAPPEILPLDIMGPAEVEAIVSLARQCFDIVVIDMPRSLVVWTEAVLSRSDIFFATMELDLRSAQDAMRFIKALRAEDLPLEKVQYVLNKAPGGMDLTGKGRIKKLAESLGVEIKIHLPDGGKQIQQAGDNGQPLAEAFRKNPTRKEIAKLAQGLHQAMVADVRASK
jgi:pilus assembly protein CpaE